MREFQKKPEDFERFYHRYVGKGEGCGCAERIIDVAEFNRLASPRVSELRKPGRIARFFRAVASLLPARS